MNHFLPISTDPHQDTPLAQQIKQQLTWLIANGQLHVGDTLPSVRQLAAQLGVNVNTVRSAYLKLEAEGLVETRQGRGSLVLPFNLARFNSSATEIRSHTIGVIIPSWSNPFYHSFLQGVEEIAEDDQSMLFLCNSHDDPATNWRDFARLVTKGVDGIIVVSHNISEAFPEDDSTPSRFSGIPFVTVDWPGSKGCTVNVDLASAGFQATTHLIEHGHQRIGLITFSLDTANVAPVNAGFRRAMVENALPVNENFIVRVPSFDIQAGAEAARKLMRLPERPTAIFTISDTLAIGALQAIKQAGLRIPDDIALVSFNNIPAASIVEPGLTTISAPTQDLGREAMKMLRILVQGENPQCTHLTLPVSLVKRESCGCQTE